jgi:hypothetical protein
MNSPKLINVTLKTRNVIATNAVGGDYLQHWQANSQKNWEDYAKRHDIGIAIFTEDVGQSGDPYSKGPAWQKLLIPQLLWEKFPGLDKVALIDTDVAFSPVGRNLFDFSGVTGLGVVSQYRNLPFDIQKVKRRLAFLRHHRFSNRYPLDSELFAEPSEFLVNRGLPPLDDFFCSGVMVLNNESTAKELASWYFRVSKEESDEIRIKHGTWEEPYVNAWAQMELPLTWMPYSFQALWNYELAYFHPSAFLLAEGKLDKTLALSCLEETLLRCDLLHFAGGWHESEAWNLVEEAFRASSSFELSAFLEYLDVDVSGKPVGKILP